MKVPARGVLDVYHAGSGAGGRELSFGTAYSAGHSPPPSLRQPSLGSFDSVSDVDTLSPAKWDVFMTPLLRGRESEDGRGPQDCSFLLFWAHRPCSP